MRNEVDDYDDYQKGLLQSATYQASGGGGSERVHAEVAGGGGGVSQDFMLRPRRFRHADALVMTTTTRPSSSSPSLWKRLLRLLFVESFLERLSFRRRMDAKQDNLFPRNVAAMRRPSQQLVGMSPQEEHPSAATMSKSRQQTAPASTSKKQGHSEGTFPPRPPRHSTSVNKREEEAAARGGADDRCSSLSSLSSSLSSSSDSDDRLDRPAKETRPFFDGRVGGDEDSETHSIRSFAPVDDAPLVEKPLPCERGRVKTASTGSEAAHVSSVATDVTIPATSRHLAWFMERLMAFLSTSQSAWIALMVFVPAAAALGTIGGQHDGALLGAGLLLTVMAVTTVTMMLWTDLGLWIANSSRRGGMLFESGEDACAAARRVVLGRRAVYADIVRPGMGASLRDNRPTDDHGSVHLFARDVFASVKMANGVGRVVFDLISPLVRMILHGAIASVGFSIAFVVLASSWTAYDALETLRLVSIPVVGGKADTTSSCVITVQVLNCSALCAARTSSGSSRNYLEGIQYLFVGAVIWLSVLVVLKAIQGTSSVSQEPPGGREAGRARRVVMFASSVMVSILTPWNTGWFRCVAFLAQVVMMTIWALISAANAVPILPGGVNTLRDSLQGVIGLDIGGDDKVIGGGRWILCCTCVAAAFGAWSTVLGWEFAERWFPTFAVRRASLSIYDNEDQESSSDDGSEGGGTGNDEGVERTLRMRSFRGGNEAPPPPVSGARHPRSSAFEGTSLLTPRTNADLLYNSTTPKSQDTQRRQRINKKNKKSCCWFELKGAGLLRTCRRQLPKYVAAILAAVFCVLSILLYALERSSYSRSSSTPADDDVVRTCSDHVHHLAVNTWVRYLPPPLNMIWMAVPQPLLHTTTTTTTTTSSVFPSSDGGVWMYNPGFGMSISPTPPTAAGGGASADAAAFPTAMWHKTTCLLCIVYAVATAVWSVGRLHCCVHICLDGWAQCSTSLRSVILRTRDEQIVQRFLRLVDREMTDKERDAALFSETIRTTRHWRSKSRSVCSACCESCLITPFRVVWRAVQGLVHSCTSIFLCCCTSSSPSHHRHNDENGYMPAAASPSTASARSLETMFSFTRQHELQDEYQRRNGVVISSLFFSSCVFAIVKIVGMILVFVAPVVMVAVLPLVFIVHSSASSLPLRISVGLDSAFFFLTTTTAVDEQLLGWCVDVSAVHRVLQFVVVTSSFVVTPTLLFGISVMWFVTILHRRRALVADSHRTLVAGRVDVVLSIASEAAERRRRRAQQGGGGGGSQSKKDAPDMLRMLRSRDMTLQLQEVVKSNRESCTMSSVPLPLSRTTTPWRWRGQFVLIIMTFFISLVASAFAFLGGVAVVLYRA